MYSLENTMSQYEYLKQGKTLLFPVLAECK
jgi:hypothetical protein